MNMTEKETEKEALWKQKKRIEIMSLVLMGVGAIVILLGLFLSMDAFLIDYDHITDPSMPISEKDNVTYTWTAEELTSQAEKSYPFLFIGLGVFVGGYVMIFTVIGDRKFHRLHCKGSSELKYCPECGLRLSRLEEK